MKPKMEWITESFIGADRLPKDREVLVVTIEGEDYLECERASQNMNVSERTPGHINTPEDPYRTERTGYLGEFGFGAVIGIQPDFTYIKNGKKEDFVYHGPVKWANDKTFDLKMRRIEPGQNNRNPRECGDCCLIIARTMKGDRQVYERKLDCDVYVCGWLEDDFNAKVARAHFVGYVKREQINVRRICDGQVRPGTWFKNWEVPFLRTSPIRELVPSASVTSAT